LQAEPPRPEPPGSGVPERKPRALENATSGHENGSAGKKKMGAEREMQG